VHTSNTTYWARWTPNPVTVTFNWNFPNAPEPVIIEADAQGRVTPPPPLPANERGVPRRAFWGWTTQRNGIDFVDPTRVAITRDTTFYAQWRNPLPEVLTVYHRFDEGFSSRFGSRQNAERTIRDYQNVVTAMLLDIFNLNVITMNPVERYTSIADRCKKDMIIPGKAFSDYLNEPCPHPWGCDSLIEIRDDLIRNLEDDGFDDVDEFYELRITWPGHILVDEFGDPGRSWWWGYPYSVVVMSFNTGTNRNEHINILLHEIAHHIGARDHYCEIIDLELPVCNTSDCWRCEQKKNENPKNCIMAWNFNNIETMDWHALFCIRCVGRNGTVSQHLRDYF